MKLFTKIFPPFTWSWGWGPAPSWASAYTQTFSGVSSVNILGATHGIGTNFIVQVYQTAATTDSVIDQEIDVDNTNGNVTITFTSNTTGKVVIVG